MEMCCKECASHGECLYNCAPAQEEKEMEKVCNKHQIRSLQGEPCRSCTADLRERWDRAFFAALTACAYSSSPDHAVHHSEAVANETIRRHADMMAARDVVIAEVMG
jgi:hypothetical protein